jgi:peptidoglycan/xylan/chitin deacetylase (PgdA/CDA1 family)
MNFSRRLVLLVAAAVVGGTGSYAAGHSAPDVGRKVTETRCRSGAIVYRADHPVLPDLETASAGHPVSGTPTGPGFTRPLVSVTFDGGWRSIADTALQTMQQYGITSTQYLITGNLGASRQFMDLSDVYKLNDAGHEIASETATNPDLTSLGAAALNFQLLRSQTDLNKCLGGPTGDLALPGGTTNPAVTDEIATHYQTARTLDAGFNTPTNFDPYGLLVQVVTPTTSREQFQAWLDTSRDSHSWLILVYQRIGASGRKPKDFAGDMRAINESGIPSLTVHRAFEELATQAHR